jgi:hypothetical protein
MRPMQRCKRKLLDIKDRLGDKLTVRVSLDHFTRQRHEEERGPGTFMPTLEGLIWLAQSGFRGAMWGEAPQEQRAGYARLFAQHAIPIDASDLTQLVLFPEMDASADVPEITDACWDILGKSPADVMCASSRMVVKRRGASGPSSSPARSSRSTLNSNWGKP